MAVTPEMIARINELYHKSKSVGLTKKELEEQKKLRKAYVTAMKANIRAQMNNVDMVNPDGSVTNLGEELAAKNK